MFARVSTGRTFLRLHDGRVLGLGWDGRDAFFGDDHPLTEVPAEIPELFGALDIRMGSSHGLALRHDGVVLSWGDNSSGQLGDATFDRRPQPEPVPALDSVIAIDAEFWSSTALLSDGTVWVWGVTHGVADDNGRGETATPHLVPGLQRIQAVATGLVAGWALSDSGVLFGWGGNDSGDLGDGTREARFEPVQSLVRGITTAHFGTRQVHVITSDGKHFGWGFNRYKLGDGTSEDRIRPVRVYSK